MIQSSSRHEQEILDKAQDPVAVLGIGTMGHAMAASALRAGIPTIVWNRRPGATDDLERQGAKVATSAADAAQRARIVVTMVTDTDAVLSIARDQAMLDALPPGAIWIQMSTIGVEGIERVDALVNTARPDITLLDAPVSGSKDPAERGELTIFASGPAHARQPVTPFFNAIGRRTVWLGPVGTGTRVKLVNNTWLAFGAEALIASLTLAQRFGLDTLTLADAVEGGAIVSPWQAAKLKRISNDDFSPEFPLSLALKDVRLAINDSGDTQLVPLGCLADEWQHVVDHGFGDEDLTVVVRDLEVQ